MVLGQNGPWTKRTRQNGPRFRTKRTTSKDKTDHVPGQNGPGFRTERTRFLDKTGPVLGQTGSCKKIHDVLQKSEESSQYPRLISVEDVRNYLSRIMYILIFDFF